MKIIMRQQVRALSRFRGKPNLARLDRYPETPLSSVGMLAWGRIAERFPRLLCIVKLLKMLLFAGEPEC